MGHGKKKFTMEDILLPSNSKPVRYDIHVTPDLDACTFRGSETIEIVVSQATNTLVLHAHELVVLPASVKCTGPTKVALESISYNVTAVQTVSFTFDEALAPGTYKFECAFEGVLNDSLAGFYKVKQTVLGKEINSACTQFEATDARRCFPCFDEPAQKAVFGMKVTAPADRVVISNGAVLRRETSLCGKNITWTFEDTPKQSSYLVAIVVGHFDCISQTGKNGVTTSIYTPKGKAHLGTFALRIGVAALEFFEEKFGLPYFGGKKVDHIAVAEFAAGAMENTGAITYREAALLIDEKESSLAMKQRVCQVVAHELSHQWFGNSTTMAWWEGLWLNEGFASFCERLATDFLHKEFQVWPQWVTTAQGSALNLDALTTTHPIEVEMVTSDDINESFDVISYMKGGSVVRMAYKWLGEEAFFKALNRYFIKHSHGNTKTTDLWAAFSEVAGQDAEKLFRNWTGCPGFPFIAVSSNGGKISLSSSRFQAPWASNPSSWPDDKAFEGGVVGPAVFEALTKANKAAAAAAGVAPPERETQDWNIPMSAVTASGVTPLGILWLDDDKAKGAGREAVLAAMAEKVAAAPGASSWLSLNAGHDSFFRTVLDEALLAKLSVAAATPADRSSSPALALPDRIGLVGDTAAAASVGLTSIASLCKLLWAMRFETEYTVWTAMLEALSSIREPSASIGGKLAEETKAFASKLLGPIVQLVGWTPKEGEAANTALLRAAVLRTAAAAGDEAVVAECLKRFDAYAVDAGATSPLSADLKQLIYSTVGMSGGAARWQKMHDLLKATDSSEEQRRLITGLGKAANDATLLRRCLAMALDGEVKSQDVPFLVGAVSSNPGELGRSLTWQWLVEGWGKMRDKGWAGGNFVWSSIVGGATTGFDSEAKAKEITAFFADPEHPAGSAERTVKQNVESIRNKAWARHITSKQADAILAALATTA